MTVDGQKHIVFGLSNIKKKLVVSLAMQKTVTTTFTGDGIAAVFNQRNFVKPQFRWTKFAVLTRVQDAIAAEGPLEPPYIMNLSLFMRSVCSHMCVCVCVCVLVTLLIVKPVSRQRSNNMLG